MEIRQEKRTDFEEIYNLVKEAFETARVSDGDEQDYVTALRNSDRYIPEFGLVAEQNNKIVGHIMLTKLEISSNGNKKYAELLLAPLCVSLPHRSKGVGALLVNESFRLAKEAGYSAVFLCGDPNYYSRFGFKQIACFDILNKSDIPPQFVLACELSEGGLKGKSGEINIV